MKQSEQFTFEISLSVLDHLGRNLYRSFATVLGEAISNAWDADAKNVWIDINKKKNSFYIKDDGIGLTALDF
jgi:HSP90 family molecular chaperone